MAKHKSLKDAIREKEFRKMIEDSLKKSYQRGLLHGTRSMLRVIGDKIAEEGKSNEEKLAEVMKMINNLLGMTDKTAQEEQEEIKNPVDIALGTDEDEAEESAEEPEAETEVETVAVQDPEDDEE